MIRITVNIDAQFWNAWFWESWIQVFDKIFVLVAKVFVCLLLVLASSDVFDGVGFIANPFFGNFFKYPKIHFAKAQCPSLGNVENLDRDEVACVMSIRPLITIYKPLTKSDDIALWSLVPSNSDWSRSG